MPWWGICIIFMCSIIIISFRKVHTVLSWQWYVSKRERDMPWGLRLFLENPSVFYGLNISGSLAQNCWLSVLRNHSSSSCWQWTRPAFSNKVQHHLISLITFWTSNIVVTCFYSIYKNSWYFFFSYFLWKYGTVYLRYCAFGLVTLLQTLYPVLFCPHIFGNLALICFDNRQLLNENCLFNSALHLCQ